MIRVLVLVEMFARSSFLNFQKKIFFNCFFLKPTGLRAGGCTAFPEDFGEQPV